MTGTISIETFLDLIRKSGAVDHRRLEQFLQKQETLPENPADLAELLIQNGLLTKYQAEPLLKGKLQRFVLSGKYRVLDRLGAGGMASVFLCEHRVMRRRVAIKILPPNMANNPSAVERFHREARAAASLQHQNIVAAHDVDVDGNFHFLVTEFVDGRNLHEMVRINGPLSIERAAHYIAQAALGLQHAYERGMVHRDIKPANLLLDRSGVVKILDMGLALLFLDDDDNLTKEHDASSILGTAEFLAPEQAMDSHAVDIRADIYSLGMTFYFLLTGKTPYGEGTTAQKLIWHQIKPPKPIQEYRPEVPAEMWAIIEKMLAKNPDDRFQTPIEVVLALSPWTSKPIPPPAESEMPRPLFPLPDSPSMDSSYTASMSFMSLPAMNLPSLLEPTSSANMMTPAPATRLAAPSSGVNRPTAITPSSGSAKPNPPSQSRAVPPASAAHLPAATPATTSDPAAQTAGPAAKTTADLPRPAQKSQPAEDKPDPDPKAASTSTVDAKKKKKKKPETKKTSPIVIAALIGIPVLLLLAGGLIWALSGPKTPKPINPTLVALNDNPSPTAPATATAGTSHPSTTPTPTTKGSTSPTPPATKPSTPPPPATKPTPPPPPATKPTPPPPPATKPTPPPSPTITAEYYPLTPRELYYDVFQFVQNANAWAYTRQKFTFKDGGTIETATVQQGLSLTPDITSAPPARSVNLKGSPQQARVEAGMVEVGTLPNPKAKTYKFEPLLKLGAKQSDTWTFKLADGDQRTYTVVAFSSWGEGKPAVTVRSVQPYTIAGAGSQLVSTHVFAKEIGEVERTINIVVKLPDGSEKTIPQLFIKLHQ